LYLINLIETMALRDAVVFRASWERA